jgi:hypothetical protein
MSQSDEARTLRRRHDALAPEAERIDAEFPQGTPALLLKTVTVGTSAPVQYPSHDGWVTTACSPRLLTL